MNKFDEYVKKYDMKVPEISYKYYHSYRVMDNMIVIAKSLNLPFKDIELAKCIGLLHDIGRFEQFKRYHSFKDCNLDHGDYGEEVLRKENLLKYFNIEKEDYEVVYKAIRLHNKYELEPDLNKRELLFVKMIRDADKIDILYALSNPQMKEIIKEDNSKILKRINDDFYKNKPVKKNDKEGLNDNIVVMFGFIFDINFNISTYLIKTREYYEKIYQRLNNKELFKPYLEYIEKYIDERID